jgi:hypothetical protein
VTLLASSWTAGKRFQVSGVEVLAEKRPLRTGLDATSILLVLAGSDVYRSMLADNGWPEAKWRSWVIQTILETLFER